MVTLPGSFMRGRQSSAILCRLDVTETIAHNQDEYVEIAVRLGLDSLVASEHHSSEWRADIPRSTRILVASARWKAFIDRR